MDEDQTTSENTKPSITRRRFSKVLAGYTAGFASVLSGCQGLFGHNTVQPATDPLTCPVAPAMEPDTYEYIVIGSGAGGGPLAANLARAGRRVLLLEAGGDEDTFTYEIPVFHGLASEDPVQKWDFFVRHYESEEQQTRDYNYQKDKKGVLYPRAGTLGGCTAHHAMITIYPHKSDWDDLASLTGDPSWSDDNMRKYFERLERCQYVETPDGPDDNPTRHGFKGWLTTNIADPSLVVGDRPLKKILHAAFKESAFHIGHFWDRLKVKIKGHLDPNDWRWREARQSPEGLIFTPLSTNEGRRIGTREYIRQVQQACPHNLTVKLRALVNKIVLEKTPDGTQKAVAVEYLEGKHLYRADPNANANPASGTSRTVKASREIIVSGGAFNTPQILMLSGIGPRGELERHNIHVNVDLPGVGQNLQDRYEVGVISEMQDDFSILNESTFKPPSPKGMPDPSFWEWWSTGKGVYSTNGAVVSLVKRSTKDKPNPDLFIFGLVGYFKGYYPTYSQEAVRNKNFFTWAVLKGHTRNRAGSVTLTSSNPRDVPHINFRYFHEGSAGHEEDLEAVVEGIETARQIMKHTGDIVKQEYLPGSEVKTKEQLRQFVKDNAWGHHASCTCAIGPKDDPMAVVDSNFRVYGTSNLRVVDASVFPRIPGFFIVTSVYMISEKASDVILAATEKH